MSHNENRDALVADQVSDATINRLNFLADKPIEEFRNSTILLSLGDEFYTLKIDNDGRLTVSLCQSPKCGETELGV